MNELAIIVVGPGALGGLLAATLTRSGRKVGLLCSGPEQAASLRRGGITISGATSLRVPGLSFAGISHRAAELGPAGVVIFCVKSYALPRALRAARPLLGAPALVALQNGVAHERAFGEAAGKAAVVGVAYAAASRTRPGRIVHGGGGRFVFDEAADANALELTQTALRRAGWETATGPLASLLWTKTCLNAAVNTLGAVSGCANGALVEIPALKELLERTTGEAQAVLLAAGIPVAGAPLAQAAARLCADSPGNVNSMLADLRAGRRTELDAIAEPVLKLARRHGVATPVLGALTRWTRALTRSARTPATRAGGAR